MVQKDLRSIRAFHYYYYYIFREAASCRSLIDPQHFKKTPSVEESKRRKKLELVFASVLTISLAITPAVCLFLPQRSSGDFYDRVLCRQKDNFKKREKQKNSFVSSGCFHNESSPRERESLTGANSKHWFTTSFLLGGMCRKAMLSRSVSMMLQKTISCGLRYRDHSTVHVSGMIYYAWFYQNLHKLLRTCTRTVGYTTRKK